MKINKQGGLIPETKADMTKAKAADLGTLPTDIAGTNCGNCSFFTHAQSGIGTCEHPRVDQGVTVRMCCAFWDNPGFLRPWKR